MSDNNFVDLSVHNTAAQYEKCVLCGKNTGVLKATPIKMRRNYVDGCGQLCKDCYKKIT